MNREEYDKFSMTLNPNTYPGHEGMTHQWFCQQHAEEFWSMLDILSKNGTKRVLEIGSAAGGTLPFFDQLVGLGGLVIGMEPDTDGGFSAISPKYSSYKPLSSLNALNGFSWDPRIYQLVIDLVGDQKLDFMFIDGDHTYEGANRDFEYYKPLVREGGIVGFHDVAIMPECRKAFEEAAIGRKHEILPVHYMGIGLVWI